LAQDAFKVLQPPSDMPENATPEVVEQLKEVLGSYFAAHLSGDQAWSLGLLSGTSESS
jgi:transcription initiation factor TFIID subunit 6